MSEREQIYKVEDVDGDRRTCDVVFINEPSPNVKGREITPGYFIPKCSEPCPWELSQFGDSQPYKNEKDWISFISQYGWRWCPMCGRLLGGKP